MNLERKKRKVNVMKGQEVKCVVCQKPFIKTNGKQLSCSARCAKERQWEQLAVLQAKRKAKGSAARPPVKCAVCEKEFVPTHTRHRHCNEDCAKKGLAVAIERQRQRRALVKKRPDGGTEK